MYMVPGAYFSFGTFQQNVFRITSKHLLLFILIHRPEFSDISRTFIETLALNLNAN